MSQTSKRFKMQRAMRNLLWASALCSVLASGGCDYVDVAPSAAPTSGRPRIDWGMSLLSNGTVGIGQLPAKFSFDVNALPDCTNDFVVFNTSLTNFTPPPLKATIMAFNNLYSTQG